MAKKFAWIKMYIPKIMTLTEIKVIICILHFEVMLIGGYHWNVLYISLLPEILFILALLFSLGEMIDPQKLNRFLRRVSMCLYVTWAIVGIFVILSLDVTVRPSADATWKLKIVPIVATPGTYAEVRRREAMGERRDEDFITSTEPLPTRALVIWYPSNW